MKKSGSPKSKGIFKQGKHVSTVPSKVQSVHQAAKLHKHTGKIGGNK